MTKKKTTKRTKKVTKKSRPRGFWLARDEGYGARYVVGSHKPRPFGDEGCWLGDMEFGIAQLERWLPQLKLEPGAKPRRVVGVEHLRFAE